jgi:hypothetical protein
MKNTDIKSLYDSIYSNNKNKHFIKYLIGKKESASHRIAIKYIENLKDKSSMIDFGCRECDFLIAVDNVRKKLVLTFPKLP